MRLLLPGLVLVAACGVTPDTAAPETSAAAAERQSLTDAYRKLEFLYGAVTALQAENKALAQQVADLSKSVGADLDALFDAGGGAAGGTCAYVRDRASGQATGKRQHKPLSFAPPPDPTTTVTPFDAFWAVIDQDGDGRPETVALFGDIDGDGTPEAIELGGDFDGDGDLFDDFAEELKRNDGYAEQICSAEIAYDRGR